MDKLALLKKFAPLFIDSEHTNKAVRGITIDTWGHAYVTDGIQLLRVREAYPEGFEGVVDLKGKRLEVERVKAERLVPDVPVVAEVTVADTLAAVKHLRDILKASTHKKNFDPIKLVGLGGELNLTVGALGMDGIQGSYHIGKSQPFVKCVEINRLIKCLEVFDYFTETVSIASADSEMQPLQLIHGEITCLLMPIREC